MKARYLPPLPLCPVCDRLMPCEGRYEAPRIFVACVTLDCSEMGKRYEVPVPTMELEPA